MNVSSIIPPNLVFFYYLKQTDVTKNDAACWFLNSVGIISLNYNLFIALLKIDCEVGFCPLSPRLNPGPFVRKLSVLGPLTERGISLLTCYVLTSLECKKAFKKKITRCWGGWKRRMACWEELRKQLFSTMQSLTEFPESWTWPRHKGSSGRQPRHPLQAGQWRKLRHSTLEERRWQEQCQRFCHIAAL